MQINNISTGTSTLPNGTLINNVCYINQIARPTTRPDGSALVVRDRWYNTDTGVEGFWNGTYWLSNQQHHNTYFVWNTTTTIGNVRFGIIPRNVPSLFTSYSFNNHLALTADSTNYWNLVVSTANNYASYGTNYFIVNNFNTNLSENFESLTTLNTVAPTGTAAIAGVGGWDCLRLAVTKVGSPSMFAFSLNIYSREIL